MTRRLCGALVVSIALGGGVLAAPFPRSVTSAAVTASRIAAANGDAVLLMRSDGSGRRSLRTRPIVGGDVTLSRDGRTVAYAALSGLFRIDAVSGKARQVQTPRGLVVDPIYARRSSTLYFLHSSSRTNVRYDLWSLSAGAGPTRHTRGADLQMLDVSPDERRVVFVRDFSEAGGRIYVSDRDGSRKRLVARGFHPAFSPDGRLLAFTARDGIRIVPAAGGRSRLAVPGGDHPVFSPDGARLAFLDVSRCIDHAYCLDRVFTVSLGGGRPRAIGPELANPGRLAWR